MCKINCSGGCPECAPEEHEIECAAQWAISSKHCICKEFRDYSTGSNGRVEDASFPFI